ncbi:MAG: molybdopterin molybdotransferase MoeA [Oxalobacter sp.]|nr:molybdopterin molybdotransferase MoeA [Oxalobacter sp.]
MNTQIPSSPMPTPDRLSVRQAQERILASLQKTVLKTEKIRLSQALGRILAEDLLSPSDVPAFNSAAMDGFAFRGASMDLAKAQSLKVVGHSYAGHPFMGKLAEGECIGIMTGAVVPDECDTVIQQEDARFSEEPSIRIPAGTVAVGDNIRPIGENLKKDTLLLRSGTRLKPQHLGLLASVGLDDIPVFRKLSVAVFSTGDELCPIGKPLEAGRIYDSNRIILIGLLKQMGCNVQDMGIIEDSPEKLEKALKEAAQKADAIITSGGVSVGAADYTKQVMAKLGGIDFWSVRMRPGRPMAFGKILSGNRETLLFGLPGNPVAAMISFLFFVRNALLVLMGTTPQYPQPITAISSTDIRKKTGRTEYQRGFTHFQDRSLHVSLTGNQGSGIIQSLTDADCIICLPEEQGNVKAGEPVSIYLLDSLL